MRTLHPGEILYARSLAYLRLRHLRLIVAMEMKGTLGGAAAETGITQPAATQMLRELEKLLEIKLVERHARGIVFTQAGQVLAKLARQTLEAMRAASDSLADVAAGRNATLQIGAVPAAITALVEPVLDELIARYSEDRFNIVELAAPESLVAGLRAGSHDLTLVREPTKPDPGLVFEPLSADELVIVAAPTHPAALLDKVTLTMLKQCEWMLPSHQVMARTAFDNWAAKARFTPGKLSSVSGNSVTLLPMALAITNAVAPTPASIVQSLIKKGVLCRLRMDLRSPLPPLGALHRGGDENPQIQKCLDVLRLAAGQQRGGRAASGRARSPSGPASRC